MRLLLSTILLIGISAMGQSPTFDPEHSTGKLYEYAEFATTGNRELDLDEMLADPQLLFLPLESDNQSVGFTTHYYWVRFKLRNSSDVARDYYLETARPVTDEALLYQIDSSGVRQFKSGDQLPFAERQVPHRSTVFKITLPPQRTSSFYVRLKSDGETINLPLSLYDADSFWQQNYGQQLFLGMFYGLLLLAGIVYLFFYRSLLERTFLYYGFYVFSIALLQASLDGLLFQFVFPDGGYLNARIVLITGLLSNVFLLKYCEHFLDIEKRNKLFRHAYNAIYAIISVLFLMLFMGEKTLAFAYPLSNLNGLISLLLILSTVLVMRVRRIPIDPYFSIGIFFLVVGLLGFVMNNLSLLPNTFLIQNSAKLGAGLEVVFLSLSMTNLIRNLRVEKERSHELALKKSEEISELKSSFMSNMSHELRTPLNAIMGVVDEQLAHSGSHGNKRNFEIIKYASISLLGSINDILDFEKIEKNQLTLRNEEFDPREALKQISDNWKIQAENKGLGYLFDMDPNLPKRVEGDRERLVQIVNNVLSNAVKFTRTGSVQFTLTSAKNTDNNYRFSLRVMDTGVGISNDMKAKIYESFGQMRLGDTRNFGGIGLGLNIVKHLVELFGGTIALDSWEGRGTEVKIDLPFKGATVSSGGPTGDSPQTIRILVVEDNALNQMVMRKFLGRWPHMKFDIVGNGSEAIQALGKETYHLVLMDIQMPIMDGYEATKIIRSGKLGERLRKIPIIAITADTTDATRKKVMDLGVNDYMTKPISSGILLEKIDSCSKVNPVRTH